MPGMFHVKHLWCQTRIRVGLPEFHGERAMSEYQQETLEATERTRAEVGRILDVFLDSQERRLPVDVRHSLVDLAFMLAEWGAGMNLTGHRGPASIMSHLICDGLALWGCARSLVAEERSGPLSDLGAGAGFPGLPVALVEPGLQVILVESRERRHHFQRAVRRKLRLTNVDPRLGRIEQLPPSGSDWVVAQAVAKPDRALALGVPWLNPGGVMLIPGNEPSKEASAQLAICESGILHYEVPDRREPRWLWWGRTRFPGGC